jgi:hypothetical protein
MPRNTPQKGALSWPLSPASGKGKRGRGQGGGRGRGGRQETNLSNSTTKDNNMEELPALVNNNKDDVIGDVSKTRKFVASSQNSDPLKNPDAQADTEQNENIT